MNAPSKPGEGNEPANLQDPPQVRHAWLQLNRPGGGGESCLNRRRRIMMASCRHPVTCCCLQTNNWSSWIFCDWLDSLGRLVCLLVQDLDVPCTPRFSCHICFILSLHNRDAATAALSTWHDLIYDVITSSDRTLHVRWDAVRSRFHVLICSCDKTSDLCPSLLHQCPF